MRVVHTYINNMYMSEENPDKECFAHKWGLVSLAAQGEDVTLLCGGDAKERKEYMWNGIKVIELPILLGLKKNNTTRLPKAFFRELLKIEADVFHTHHYASFVPELTMLAGNVRGIPTFIGYHTTFQGRSGFIGLLERAYGLCLIPTFPFYKKHFFLSEHGQKIFPFSLIKKSKRRKAPNFIRHPPTIKIEKEENSLLHVGRITFLKGIDIIIKALPLIKKEFPNVRFDLVGKIEGSFPNEMKTLAKDLGVEENVHFLGPKYGKEKWEEMYKHEVMIMASRGDAFGNVIIESMLCNTPVVLSDQGGISETAGGKGLLFHKDNHKELATQVINLLKDKKRREKMAKEAYEYAKEYTSDRIGEIFLEEYDTCLRK